MALPLSIRSKVRPRILRWRLAAQGYIPRDKKEKDDLGKPYREARLAFCSVHEHRDPQGWHRHLQGCGDFIEIRYHPRTLRARFRRYSASWTYMTVGERKKPAFSRPKKFFKRKELRGTQKCKVFGFTTSSGRQLAVAVLLPFTSKDFAVVVRRRLGPLLRAEFPSRRHFRILLDGEPLLHDPPAKVASRNSASRFCRIGPPIRQISTQRRTFGLGSFVSCGTESTTQLPLPLSEPRSSH